MLGTIRVNQEDADQGTDPKNQFQWKLPQFAREVFHMCFKIRKGCHSPKMPKNQKLRLSAIFRETNTDKKCTVMNALETGFSSPVPFQTPA